MPMISYAMEDEPRWACRYSETRVEVSRKHSTQVDATFGERRPCAKLKKIQLLWFRSNCALHSPAKPSESPPMDARFLRNFAIIAHIDHGKSTLSDRLLEFTGAVTGREMQAQILDDMDLERERGITIKAHAVRMMYKARDGNTYQLNLIDTPGHVDFSYEVSRSLASCEGALLVVDASQGVEAQTLANAYLAINHGLEIIPVINKIDLPSADVLHTQEAIEQAVGLDATGAIPVSAKTGQGVDEVLEAIVHRLPAPKGDPDAPLQALIFDSWFDAYRGVIVLARVMQGTMRKGQRIRLMSNGKSYEIESMGVLCPKPVEIGELTAGEVGFFAATIKNVGDTKIGDTITDDAHPAAAALPGFEDIKPMVFSGLYTVDAHEHTLLRDALEKLRLNDSSFFFEPESSVALGFGFRCGFLGLLHMEIIQERLEREYRAGPDHHRARRALPHHTDRRKGDRGRQPLALARAAKHRQHPRASHCGQDPHQRGVRRRNFQTRRGKAGKAAQL